MTGVLAARTLGPEQRGYFAAAQVAGGLFAVVATLGIGEGLVYFAGKDPGRAGSYLKTGVVVGVLWSALVVLGGAAVMPLILSTQQPAVRPAQVYSLIAFTFVVLGFPTTLIRAQRRFTSWNVLRATPPMAWLVALILFRILNVDSLSILAGLFIGLQALLIPLAWRLVWPAVSQARIDRRLVRPLVGYSLPLMLAAVPQALNLRVDQLLLARSVSAVDLGIYAVSVTWANVSLPIMAAVGGVLYPTLAHLDSAQARLVLGKSVRLSLLIALPVAFASAVLAPVAVPAIFGSDFAPSGPVASVLAVASVFLGVNVVLREGLTGVGMSRPILTSELVGLAVTGLLLIFLVPRFGVIGAAMASVAAYLLVFCILISKLALSTGSRVSELLKPRRDDFYSLWHALPFAGWRR